MDSAQKQEIASPEFNQTLNYYRQLSGLIQQQSQTSEHNAALLKHLQTQGLASQVSFDKYDQQFYSHNATESNKKYLDQHFDQKAATSL